MSNQAEIDALLASISETAIEGEIRDTYILCPKLDSVEAIVTKAALVANIKTNGEVQKPTLRADMTFEILDDTAREVCKQDHVYVNSTMFLRLTEDGRFDAAGNVPFFKMLKAFGVDKSEGQGKSLKDLLSMIVSRPKEGFELKAKVRVNHKKQMSQDSNYQEPDLDEDGNEIYRAVVDAFAKL